MRAITVALPILMLSLARPAASLPEGAIPAPHSAFIAERFRAAATADTCRAVWDEPTYYLWEFAQERCEATRCSTPLLDPITAVGVVWFNYGQSAAEKPVRIFIADDAGGLPGEILWSIETTTGLLAEAETRLATYAVDPPLVAWGQVWFGHEEMVAGPPSSLFDGVIDGWSASSAPPCGSWEAQELADYLQLLVSGDPTSDIADIDPRSSGLRVVSPARGTLEVDFGRRVDSEATLTLFDAGGRIVLGPEGHSLEGAARVSLPLRGLPGGVYFLRATCGGVQGRRTVVILE